ncbi:helix-turn-helix domain-containing protein [Zophobihabitans entericus]|uniref:Helix-turn-helix domain-containing protein n=1 Tax=Zophobihabitans entericus TaxID=1635327 RepID=A0A6G9IDR4_9GAMM|nr:helix-turn-helix domain-containing protein [Zophobihabitans entericus]QIQ21977.1 helix-turn-helix domain-containing protein [Zophobihabitans entericus]
MSKILHLSSQDYFISSLNTITVEERRNQEPFALHSHEFDELVIVSAGHGLHVWNDISYPITCGDIFYINHDDIHSYESVNNLRLDNILYKREQLSVLSIIEHYLPSKKAPEAERFWKINPSYLEQISTLIDNLAKEVEKPEPLSIHLAESLFLQLVIVLCRFRYHPDQITTSSTHQLDILFSVLHNNMATSFNLELFCEQQQISSRSLRRLFKAKTGMTIKGYSQQLRMCKAMNLLRNSKESISTIAAECGYDDSNYFSSAFHKETSLTPSEYRSRFIVSK